MEERLKIIEARQDGIEKNVAAVLDKMGEAVDSIKDLTNELSLDRKDSEITRESLLKLEVKHEKLQESQQLILQKLPVIETVQAQFAKSEENQTTIKNKIIGSLITAFTLGGVGVFAALKGLS